MIIAIVVILFLFKVFEFFHRTSLFCVLEILANYIFVLDF